MEKTTNKEKYYNYQEYALFKKDCKYSNNYFPKQQFFEWQHLENLKKIWQKKLKQPQQQSKNYEYIVTKNKKNSHPNFYSLK